MSAGIAILKYVISICIVILSIPLGNYTVTTFLKYIEDESHKSKYDQFVTSGVVTLLIRFVIIVVAVIIALKISNIPLLLFVSALGVVGIIVPLALQGPLQDFASGILLVAFDRIRVGDYIKIVNSTIEGTIIDIHAFETEVKHPLTNVITDVPNGAMWKESIESMYRSGDFKLRIALLISNRNDIKMVERIIKDILKKHPAYIDVDITYTTNDHRGLHIDLAVIADSEDMVELKAELYRDLKIGLQERGVIFVDGAAPVTLGFNSEEVYPIIIKEAEVPPPSRLLM